MAQRTYCCLDCGYTWGVDFTSGKPTACPKCQGTRVERAREEQEHARGAETGRGSCGPGGAKATPVSKG